MQGVDPVFGAILLAALFLSSASCGSSPRAARPAHPIAASADAYAGHEACLQCHKEEFGEFGATKMGRRFLHQPQDQREALACENCHGPAAAHVDAGGQKNIGGLISFMKGDRTPVEQRTAMCLSCHEKNARFFWEGSPHEARDVTCTNCHRVHQNLSPRHQLAKSDEIQTCGQCHLERRAQQMRSSHMPLREGKMTCTACHNPHGGVTQANLKANSVNDTCFTCHAEKRGPFLWEHAPATESCTNCHDPHGSNHEGMLKVAKPRLCQQCHVVTRHPTRPYGQETNPANQKFILGRQCVNCHVNIHGSNHPSGFAFTR
jgi:DmsE family decaheme c-type cytochrome